MARTNAISILRNISDKADLAEIYGFVVENLQKESLAFGLKNQDYTGNPAAGSAVFKRIANTGSEPYGTARAGGGNKIVAPEVVVNLSVHREIINEVAKFDLDAFGVGGLLKRKALSNLDTLSSELDIAFFTEIATADEAETTADTAVQRFDEAVAELETTQSAYVRGIPRNRIVCVGTPAFYGSLRTHLDGLANANVNSAVEEFGMRHGVRVYSSVFLPAGYEFLVFAIGSTAQPVVIHNYTEPAKIPQSNDWSIDLFFDYGTKLLGSELALAVKGTPSTLVELDVTSKAGSSTGDTKIDVDPVSPASGTKYVYKLGKAYATFKFGADLSTWTNLTQNSNIAAGENTHITVAGVTTTGSFARSRGIARLVKEA